MPAQPVGPCHPPTLPRSTRWMTPIDDRRAVDSAALAGFPAVPAADINRGRRAVADLAPFDVEQVDRVDQFAELGEAVVARIELRRLLRDRVADGAERRPAGVVGGRLD